MHLIILTEAEREKFSSYLEQEAKTNEGLAKQMDNFEPLLAEVYRNKINAYMLVSYDIRVKD